MLMVLSAGGAKGLSAISYMNQVASERLKMYTCVCVYAIRCIRCITRTRILNLVYIVQQRPAPADERLA